MLNCNIHMCPHRCHQLQDHSKMECKAIIVSKCSKGHKITRKCHDKAAAICRKCEAELRAQEKRRQRDYKLDQDRQAKQQAYAAKLAEIEEEIEHQKRRLNDQADEENRQHALAQKKQDLLNLKKTVESPSRVPVTPQSSQQPSATSTASGASRQESATQDSNTSSNKSEAPSSDGASAQSHDQPDWDKSEARDDWQEQKELWGAENDALDSLMSMIGKCHAHGCMRKLTVRRSRVCQGAISCHQKQGRYSRSPECAS